MGGGLAIGQLDMEGDLGLPARRVTVFVGFDTHIKLVCFRAHANLGQAQPECGLAQIHQRRRCHILAALVPERCPPLARRPETPGEKAVPRHLAQAPAQGQHAHVDVGPPAVFNFQIDGGVLAIELHDLRGDDALTLHCHQRGGKAERHAHLKLGGLARLVAFFLGQQVHAVMVLAAKPQIALLGDVDAGGGLNAVARCVLGGDHQFHFTGFFQ